MNVSILSPFYLSPLFAFDSAIFKILKTKLQIRYTLIFFNFVRHIESASLNFENLTWDS